MKKLYYILASLLFVACSSEDALNTHNGDDALEIKGINADVDNGQSVTRTVTRALSGLSDTVGRKDFVANDTIMFTKIQRTDIPIPSFSYPHEGEVINYKRNAQTSWERVSKNPERIYWSDAERRHTFIGYGCPQGKNTPEEFDWNKVEYGSEGYYAYFGSLGNPTLLQTSSTVGGVTTFTNFIDYSNDSDDVPDTNSKKYYSGNAKLSKDDILLAHNIEQKADPGGQVATIHFKHGLCCVRVVVNISSFAASATSADSKSKVTDLELLDMCTMYKWRQLGNGCEELVETDQHFLDDVFGASSGINWNQKKNIRCWIPNPDGVGEGNGKTFTFYGLAVPTQGKTQYITFYVTYPDPMNPDNNITRPYTANISGVDFRAGYCTTINISLNHRNDKMTVGAEYKNWIFKETPDQGELRKNTTFLSSVSRSDVTIVGDELATVDDATWLYATGRKVKYYTGETVDEVLDIYGNDGSPSKPYVISNAYQLLSFAYEVKNGRNFVHQYVKLDADITMQENGSSSNVNWIGIGDSEHPFDGFFLGNNRHINYLKGKSFFSTIGENAVIDKVDFAHVIEVNGSGVFADVNNGLVCACVVDGDVKQSTPSGSSTSYCGSLVGDNRSFIIACTHEGTVSGYGYVGGLVGRNAGTIIASYHSGLVEYSSSATDSQKKNMGGSTGLKESNSQIFSSYFNKELIVHTPETTEGKVAYGLTTSMMQSYGFVNRDASLPANQYKDIVGGNNITIDVVDKDADKNLFKYRFCLNDAMSIFGRWLQSMPEGQSVVTNCRTFTADQIRFLKEHYGTTHTYHYAPGTYPKIQ